VEGLESSEDPTVRGSELARERTDLAWNRSGLGVLVAVVVLLRHLWPLDGYKSELALAFIGVGATTWAVGMRMARRGSSPTGAGGRLGERSCRLLTVGTLLLAGAGFVLGVVS
jgi:uncharacterized membrane protein YidH (DUF202 family)